MYLCLLRRVSLGKGWWVYWPDESKSEAIALSAPVKLKLGAHVSIEQTHAIMAHQASDVCFDTPGSSLEVMEQFSSPHSQCIC